VSISRLTILFLLIAIPLLMAPVHTTLAGDEWLPIDPADLKMTSDPKAPGAPAIYLYRQVDRKDDSRAGTEYNYIRIKILTEEGRRYGNIEIPYYHQDASVNISGIRARSIRPDGTIVNFDGKIIDKTLEKTKGEKILAKTFSIPDIQVGSIVEYHFNYDFADYYVFNSYWGISSELYTRLAKFTLKPYPEWFVRWSWPAGLPAGTTPPKQDADNFVRLTVKEIPAFQEEDFMPPPNELKYRVLFTYSQDQFESDPARFWKKFGKKQNDRLESFIGKRKDLEQQLSQIVAASDAPDAKLRKIYARVQQIKNLDYQTEKTKLEEKRDKLKEPENANDVFKLGYARGTQINWLFVGLARTAGLDAAGAWVASRNDYFFNENRMNSSELNSSVAIVKLDGTDQFFDPGSLYLPYGLLPWQETSTKGLKLDHDGGSWVITPLTSSSSSEIKRTADFKLTDDGALEGKVTLSFTGIEAFNSRTGYRLQDAEARKKYLEEIIKDDIPAAADVDLVKQPEWESSELPLTAEFDVKIPGWTSAAGRRAIMPTGIFSAPEKHMFDHAIRVNDVYFHYAYRKTDTVHIELPPGWQVDSMPKDQDNDAKAAEYIFKIEKSPGALQYTRVLRVDLGLVPKNVYSSLRGFYQLVKSNDEQQIVLQPAAAAAQN